MYLKMLHTLIWTSILLTCIIDLTNSTTDKKPPHILFIVGDDMGYNDVGWHNQLLYTPNMNQLAKSGVILEQYYTLPVCSPSRAAIMTGLYPSVYGFQRSFLLNQEGYGLPLKYKFISQRLKEANYSTHQIGKWHLGYCDRRYTPLYRGFDTHFGFYTGCEENYIHCVSRSYIQSVENCTGVDLHDNGHVGFKHAGKYSTELWIERSEEIIRNHKENSSLFIYLTDSGTHFPLQPPKKYYKYCKQLTNKARRRFCAATAALDIGIGKLIQALKDKGYYDNSVIIFVSDNGGATNFGGNNFPLRGEKNSLWEGGTRVPAFVHSPLLEISGYAHNGMFHAVDWYPTLLHLAGLEPDDGWFIGANGLNQWEMLSKNHKSARFEFLYLIDMFGETIVGAVRKDDWKLITGPAGSSHNVTTEDLTSDESFDGDYISAQISTNPYDLNDKKSKLYNLKNDPFEQNDLSEQEPAKVQELWILAHYYMNKSHSGVKLMEDPAGNPENYEDVYESGWCKAYSEAPTKMLSSLLHT